MKSDRTMENSEYGFPTVFIGIDDADRFGLCPRCVENGDYGATYTYLKGEWSDVLCCIEHRCFWQFGWHYPDPDQELEQVPGSMAAMIAAMTEVEPRLSPETECRKAAWNCRNRLISQLCAHLSDNQQKLVIDQLHQMTDRPL